MRPRIVRTFFHAATRPGAGACVWERCLPVLLLLLLLTAAPCPAQEQDKAALATLEKTAAQVRSIESDFVQTKHLQVFATELVSKGRMLLEKPDRLRWEYLEPSKQGFVVDGDQAMRWSELSPKPERFSIDQDMAARIVAEQLLAWASVDLERLRANFEITVEQDEPAVLSLKPRGKRLGQYLARIRVSFAPDGRAVRQVEIAEQDGDSTLLTFENVRLNEKLPEGAFGF